MLFFIIKWCPVRIYGAVFNHMHYMNGYCLYRCITVIKGVSLPMCLFLGRMTLSGLILFTVHRRVVGNLVLNILGRGTMKRFWSKVDSVPVRL